MNCRKVNHLLSAYMDGELPGVEHRQIHEHLARCRECADEYAGLLRMKRLLAGMRVREPRTELASRIVNRVHDSRESPRDGIGLRWTQQVGLWLKGAAPGSRPALALGAGLAIMGVMAVSRLVDGQETIHWSPVSTSAIASHALAPDDTLVPQGPDSAVRMQSSLSSVGYNSSQFPLVREGNSDSNAKRESVIFLSPPPQMSLIGPR